MPTDTERLDFLQADHDWTFWVGYSTADGSVTWPVFGRMDVRVEIDRAMKAKKDAEGKS